MAATAFLSIKPGNPAPRPFAALAVAGFPNLFLLIGPNSRVGYNSIVFMIEAQTRYILAVPETNARAALPTPSRRVPEEQTRFNARLQQRMARTVYASGCKSWYLDETGKGTILWPGLSSQYWKDTRRLNRRSISSAELSKLSEASNLLLLSRFILRNARVFPASRL